MDRRGLWIIATATLAAIVATAPASARDEKIINPNPDRMWASRAGGLFTAGKSIAVVIAISDYVGVRNGGYPALSTARHDADKMVAFLTQDAGFDIVYVLTDEHATKAKIDRLMTEVMPGEVGARDRFLFYWSGHGDQMMSADGRRSFGFLPLANSRTKEFSGMVSMQDLERWDRYLDARQALFVLDACLSGLAGVETKAPRDARLEQLSLPARHLLTAGTARESVISGDRWGGSLFTDSFILGARGQASGASGIVSLFSLIEFIQDRVAIEKQMANWSKSLTPQLQSLQAGNGAFFFTPKGASIAPTITVRPTPAPEPKSIDRTALSPSGLEANPPAGSGNVLRLERPEWPAAPSTSGPFTLRTGTEAQGTQAAPAAYVDSVRACEQRCSQSAACTIFTYSKINQACYLYSQARLVPNAYFESGIRGSATMDSRESVSPPAGRLFTVRSGMEAQGSQAAPAAFASSIGACERSCAQTRTCTVFTYSRSTQSCYLYSQARVVANAYFDSGISGPDAVNVSEPVLRPTYSEFTLRTGMEAQGSLAAPPRFLQLHRGVRTKLRADSRVQNLYLQ